MLWAELSTGGRGTADRLNAARFDPVSGWVLADARVGLAAGDGLTWRRIRAVSDGAAVVALYERSDGALFARRWDSANGFVGARTLAAAGATSSDVTLHQGAPMAAYILAEHVVVEPVPEPALGSAGPRCSRLAGAAGASGFDSRDQEPVDRCGMRRNRNAPFDQRRRRP